MPTQKQHLVPEFLLKGFVAHGSNKMYGFDKWEDRIFETTPEKAAKESGFYDVEVNGASVSFEEPLSRLEGDTAPVIKKLLDSPRISDLPEEERVRLGLFCAVQMLRDKNSRENALEFRNKLVEKISRMGFGPNQVKASLGDLTDEDIKLTTLMAVGKATTYLPHLLNKTWSLQAAPPDHFLYISDSPVTLENRKTFGSYGNLGLALPGIQITMPISATMTIWITCPSIEHEFRTNYQNAALSGTPVSHPSMREIRSLLTAFEGTQPFTMRPENVDHFNSQQVDKAERFLFSRVKDFSMARRMIKDHPEFKKGRRLRFG
jgi:uncharacterized protein DUF4238